MEVYMLYSVCHTPQLEKCKDTKRGNRMPSIE
jgi:hypothetical protein